MRVKKVLIALGLTAVVAVVGSVGLYYYTLHRHAQEIAELLYLFSQLELEEEGAPVPGQAEQPGPGSSSDPSAPRPPAPLDGDEDEADPSRRGTAPPPPAGRDPADPASPQTREGEEPLPAGLPPELQDQVRAQVQLIRRVELQDQLYAKQILQRFTTREIQQMYRLFQEGGSARGQLLEMLRERLEEEEIRKIRDIARKYVHLLE